jgi:hypothetical protein
MSPLIQDQFKTNRYEKVIAGGGDLFFSRLAGISRVSRLSFKGWDDHLKIIWDTGANVIGPILFLFMLWVFEKAKQMGLKRLYFISRDGQILNKIAQLMNTKWGFNVDCRYLYGSRQAWFFPASENSIESELEGIFLYRIQTVQSICSQIIQEPDILRPELVSAGFVESTWSNPLDLVQQERLKECLLSDAVQNKIEKRKLETRNTTLGYLIQEKLYSDTAFGFVDFGWTGKSLGAVSKILSLSGYDFNLPLRGFYFGLSNQSSKVKNVELNSFMFKDEAQFRGITSAFMQLLEIFACADHSSLKYYKKSGSHFEPVLKGNGKNINLNWGILTQHSSVLNFVETFIQSCKYQVINKEIVQKVVKKLLLLFMKDPEKSEAEAYGKYRFSSSKIESDMREIAPVLDTRSLIRYIFGKKIYREIGDIWIEGAVTRSLKKKKSLIHFILRIRRKLGIIKRKLF